VLRHFRGILDADRQRTMNKYEKRAQAERKSVLRSSLSLGGAGLAIMILGVLVLWLSSHGPVSSTGKIVVGLAVFLLVFRIVGRILSARLPKAARPDPQSTLKLD
jgi:hypothetical protein